MKDNGKGKWFTALALSAALVGGVNTASAQKLEVDLSFDGVDDKVREADATIVAVKGSTIYTSQTIDGVEVRFEWVVPDAWVSPDGDGVAYGVFDTIVKLGLAIWDRMQDGDKGGGGGGGGGGGTTNTCNITVTGATVVVVGNLNCGGTQTGTDGTGTGTGGGGGGGTRPQ